MDDLEDQAARSPPSKERIEGIEDGGSESRRSAPSSRRGTARPQSHGLDNCSAELSSYRSVTARAEPGSDNVGAVLLGGGTRSRRATPSSGGKPARDPGGEGLLGRIVDPLGRPIDGKGAPMETRDASRRVQGAGRRPGKVGHQPLQTGIKATRLDGSDRPRPARADHGAADRQRPQVAIEKIINNRNSDTSRCTWDRPAMATIVQVRRAAARVRRARQHEHRRRPAASRTDQVHRAVPPGGYGGVLSVQGRPRPVRYDRPEQHA